MTTPALEWFVQLLMITVTFSSEPDYCVFSEHDTWGTQMGTVVQVADVNDITDIEVIRQALQQHGVIVIPNQRLTRQQQVEFSEKLGNVVVLRPSMQGNDAEEGYPEIHRVTNYWANGTWKGSSHCFGCYWHKDGDFQENDYIASMLYADQVTPGASTTLFLDNCAAYQNLSLPALITLARSTFSVSIRDIPDFIGATQDDLAHYHRHRLHPGVHRHPGDGRKCAYMTGTLFTAEGAGTEGLEAAWQEMVERSPKYVHVWKEGDIVIWDNLAVMHRVGPRGSREGSRTPRMLFRTQVYLKTAPEKMASRVLFGS